MGRKKRSDVGKEVERKIGKKIERGREGGKKNPR